MTAFSLSQLLTQSAARTPEAVALIAPKSTLSYAELDDWSTEVARTLVESGARPGEPIGLALPKSIESIVAAYAIMKAGCAYVPLDVFAPAARNARIVDNTAMRFVIAGPQQAKSHIPQMQESCVKKSLAIVFVTSARATQDTALHRAPIVQGGASKLQLQSWTHSVALEGEAPRALPQPTDTDLAYILHTSGSTGTPKGVTFSHRNALCFVQMATEFWKIEAADVLCSQAPLHFDLSVFDLYVAANAGASLVLLPEFFAAFPKKMSQAIETHGVTIWNSVVSTLSLLLEKGKTAQYNFESVRAVLFSGELMPLKTLRPLLAVMPNASMYNVYGQTEANSSMYFKIDPAALPDDDAYRIPLGRAFPNFRVFAMTESGAPATKVDEVGELYVRAHSVAKGYWGNPELTATNFPLDPQQPESMARVYRTGDLVRLNDKGEYIFVGRRDNLIKSRGYRIELGEIDLALFGFTGVSAAAALAIPDPDIGHRIVAAVSLRKDQAEDEDALVAHLRRCLPKYMVPEAIEFKDELPRTSTNKVDRRALVAYFVNLD